MDSRERTFLALNFEEPDRVPIDLWISKGMEKLIYSSLKYTKEEYFNHHDVDLRYIEGPKYIGPPLQKFSQGIDEDIWGVQRQAVTVPTKGGEETYKEVYISPLSSAETVEEINVYNHWPSPDWFDYSCVEEQCVKIRNQGKVAVFMGDRLNRLAQLKPAMYIRGVEGILIDMSLNPEIAKAIFSNIRNFYCAYAERIFDAANGKIDILLTGDDFGSQNGSLVSTEMWLDFLLDGFKKYIDIAHSFNIKVMHHTCGSVRNIIPHMIDAGLDILQSLQPEALNMNPGELKSEFGNKLAFHGGISIQKTLPFGTPNDIKCEVKNRLESFGKGGGYIISTAHNIQSDTPIENLETLLNSYKDYGRYS